MFAHLLAATLAASPRPATGPSLDDTFQALHDQCLIHAADPKNPWALAHGITALGANFVATDGRKAVDVIVKDFLLKNPLVTDAGLSIGSPYGFQRFALDGTPVEPHANLLTKTFVLSGLPLTTRLQTAAGPLTLGDLVRSVELGFLHAPSNEEYWRDVAWTLDLLSHTRDPKHAKFTRSDGTEIDFNQVMNDALTYLEQADSELEDGLKKGQPIVPKRKLGIYSHHCGGLHLVQAVLTWARFPEVKKAWGARYDRQLAVLFYRLESERAQYDQALSKATNTAPQFVLPVLVQQVKFFGHFLETTGRLRSELKWKPDAVQTQSVAKAKAFLDHAVRQLTELKAFERMDELKKSQRQVYLDLIGDSCHAAHGWEAWK